MKILAFAASSSRQSINKQLVMHAAQTLKSEYVPTADIDLIDLNDFEMPIYSIDRENESGIPDEAHRFYEKIGTADALLISYAEHNGSYTAAYKNIFDWASRIQMKVFQDKPMVIMSTSLGPNGGQNVLKSALDSAPHFGADVKGHFKVGPFGKVFEDGRLSDTELAKQLRSALSALKTDLS